MSKNDQAALIAEFEAHLVARDQAGDRAIPTAREWAGCCLQDADPVVRFKTVSNGERSPYWLRVLDLISAALYQEGQQTVQVRPEREIHILSAKGAAVLRFHGVDIEKAIRACGLLIEAYERGRESEHVDWSDVDLAHGVALEALRGVDTPDEATEPSTGAENASTEGIKWDTLRDRLGIMACAYDDDEGAANALTPAEHEFCLKMLGRGPTTCGYTWTHNEADMIECAWTKYEEAAS